MHRVQYLFASSLTTSYHPWTKQASNFPRLRGDKVAKSPAPSDTSGPGGRSKLCPVQKRIHDMKSSKKVLQAV